MPPSPAPMIVTVVAFAGWFMRGSSLQRSPGRTGSRLRVGNHVLLAPASAQSSCIRVLVDTFPRGLYSPAAQIHRVQFRPGPTDVGMGDGAWRDAPFQENT